MLLSFLLSVCVSGGHSHHSEASGRDVALYRRNDCQPPQGAKNHWCGELVKQMLTYSVSCLPCVLCSTSPGVTHIPCICLTSIQVPLVDMNLMLLKGIDLMSLPFAKMGLQMVMQVSVRLLTLQVGTPVRC